MPYLSFLGEPKFSQSHGQCVNSSVPLGPSFQSCGNILYVTSMESKRCPFSSRCFKSLRFTHRDGLKYCHGLEQVIGCPILGSAFVGQVVPSFPQ